VSAVDRRIRLKIAEHQHSVADCRRKFFDPIQEFWLLGWRGGLQLLGYPREILTHQNERTLDALMIGGTPMGALARSLQISYLNDFGHIVTASAYAVRLPGSAMSQCRLVAQGLIHGMAECSP
jgi:hypothetical protein